MGLENSPYVGTWKLNQKGVVQHTPDALVYVNGDTSLPGCPKCNGRIDLQEWITEVSVDAGTESGSASASFTVSVPVHSAEPFNQDGNSLLRVGLEVHVYMRGYFPVSGLYQTEADPLANVDISTSLEGIEPATQAENTEAYREPEFQSVQAGNDPKPETRLVKGMKSWKRRKKPLQVVIHESTTSSLEGAERVLQSKGLGAHYVVDVDGNVYKWLDPNDRSTAHTKGNNNRTVGVEIVSPYYDYKANDGQPVIVDGDWVDRSRITGNKNYAVPPAQQMEAAWALMNIISTEQGIPLEFPAEKGDTFSMTKIPRGEAAKSGIISHQHWGDHADGSMIALYCVLRKRGYQPSAAYTFLLGVTDRKVALPPKIGDSSFFIPTVAISERTPENEVTLRKSGDSDHDHEEDEDVAAAKEYPQEEEQVQEEFDDPTPEKSFREPTGGSGLEDVIAYPYYHVFHGVVTQVSESRAPGSRSFSVQCSSMLHFWQYHNLSINASIFGSKPTNSKLKSTLKGNNFAGMHPYEIMYSLHYDMAGAAGGVGWALSQKTNQSARSEITGDSLFSLNVEYWRRRFSTRMIKLRMHAATGELFTAAQASYLSRLSTSDITSLLRQRFANPLSFTNQQKKVLSASHTLGLFNRYKREALRGRGQTPDVNVKAGAALGDLVLADSGGNKKFGVHFDVNLPEMQAFVKNLSELGSVNLFESTYESKLDIAQKVAEVTGFEFYQDVDGDFVFKPPFYNLDTSESRVYRIEDIDIINFSPAEKEPQFTYITGKNPAMHNLQGTGLENEWGVRGTYIDYRLVAQFGWRPASYEATYLNDPKALFFASVARLDVLNVATYSASLTIPIRPEMRPGYPVYIPSLDSFYYCNSLSHQFSAGGRCTTSLQLVGRRTKFFAPGDRSRNGVDAIDLSNTILPPHPLEVLDSSGLPKIAGFPNVVMALDANKINPLFALTGLDSLKSLGEDAEDAATTLQQIVQIAEDMGILRKEVDADGNVSYIMDRVSGTDENQNAIGAEERFYIPNELPATSKGKTKNKTQPLGVDLISAARAYQSKRNAFVNSVAKERAKLVEAQRDLTSVRTALSQNVSDKRKEELKKQRSALQTKIQNIQRNLEARDLDQELTNNDKSNPQVRLLMELVQKTTEHLRSQHPDFKDLNATSNLLDILSDKKATFSNGSQPGAYRYYSASHPDPEQQGQPDIKYGENRITLSSNNLEQAQYVQGFVSNAQVTAPFPGARLPDTAIGQVRVAKGLRVLTSDPNRPTGEVLPTNDIRELSFSVQTLETPNNPTNTVKVFETSRFTKKDRKDIQRAFRVAGNIPLDVAPVSVFFDLWSDLADKLAAAGGITTDYLLEGFFQESKAEGSAEPNPAPSFPAAPEFPDTLKIKGQEISLYDALSAYKFDNNPSGTLTLPSTYRKKAPMKFIADIGQQIGALFFEELKSYKLQMKKALRDAGYTAKDTQRILNEKFMTSLSQLFSSGTSVATDKQRQVNNKAILKKPIVSPVFPVSDEKGFRVIGSYRYGRGVTIEPNGVFDILHRQDVFQYLDRQTVDLIADFARELSKLDLTEVTNTEAKRQVQALKVKGRGATFAELESKVFQSLRKNLSNQDLLDLGLLQETGSPNQLEFNLANYIADGNNEGVEKLPAVNAAYSLADMGHLTSKRICDCAASDARVLLDSLGLQQFVSFAGADGESATPNTDTDVGTQFLMAATAAKIPEWRDRQENLRGRTLKKDAGTFLKTGENAFASFESALERAEGRVQLSAQELEDVLGD